MRFLLIVALLFDLSPIPAAAALFEGRAPGEPVVRPVVGIKPVDAATLPAGLETPALVPGAAIPELPGAGLVTAETPAALAAAPGAAPIEPQAPLTQPSAAATLPVLESVGARLDRAPEPARVMDFTYDKWADDGGPARDDAWEPAEQADLSPALMPAAAPATPRNEEGVSAVPTPSPQASAPWWRRAIPNLLTTGNLWSGLAGAYLASQGRVVPAVIAIIAANVFDMHDGMAARALKVKNPLGIDYDSLADVVSFGVAPALLIFKAALLPALGAWGFPIAAVFASAGWFRLSRFNVAAHAEEMGLAAHKASDTFTGLPIPGGAGVLAAAALALTGVSAGVAAAAAVAMTLLAAGAMASRLPYPAFKHGGLKARVIPAAVGLAVAAPLALLGHFALIPAALFGLYLATGPLNRLWQGGSETWKKEVKRKGFHQSLLLSIPAFFLIPAAWIAPLSMAAIALVGAFEFFRLKVPAARPFFDRFFGRIIRDKEADRPSGSFYVAMGLGLVASAVTILGLNPLLFPAAALALGLGDAASPLVGMRFGFKPYKVMGTQRSVDGTAAGFAVALGIGLALGFPWFAALGAAAAFSLVDVFPVKPDDNLWIPIVFSAALALLSLL